jgi:hypothetical protein
MNYAGMAMAVTIEEIKVRDGDSGSLLQERKCAERVKWSEFVVLTGLGDAASS